MHLSWVCHSAPWCEASFKTYVKVKSALKSSDLPRYPQQCPTFAWLCSLFPYQHSDRRACWLRDIQKRFLRTSHVQSGLSNVSSCFLRLLPCLHDPVNPDVKGQSPERAVDMRPLCSEMPTGKELQESTHLLTQEWRRDCHSSLLTDWVLKDRKLKRKGDKHVSTPTSEHHGQPVCNPGPWEADAV